MLKKLAVSVFQTVAFALYAIALMFVTSNFIDDVLQWQNGFSGATSAAINVVAFGIITAFVTREKGNRWGG